MPGFDLSRLAAKYCDANSGNSVMILKQHGLVTAGDTARESYEAHIEAVGEAETYIAKMLGKSRVAFGFSQRRLAVEPILKPAQVLPILRGALALKNDHGVAVKRFMLDLRRGAEIDEFLSADNLIDVVESAPLTPDHTIRTKLYPALLKLGSASDETEISECVQRTIEEYEQHYIEYFGRSCRERTVERTRLDSKPRVVVIPGLGVVGVGDNARAAAIAADIFEHTLQVKSVVNGYSSYKGLGELDLFDVEYWSLEQAKLGKRASAPLEGQVALITGGTGAIGIGVASVLKAAGAEVVITDVRNVEQVAADIGVTGMEMDVSSATSVKNAMMRICEQSGGIDILVPNAGIAVAGAIDSLSAETAHAVMDVNFHGTFLVIREAAKILKRQATGGHVVLISSKNVLAPGAGFGLYSASKAASHQLAKVAALELAEHGIRVNMVTPDAVFGTETVPSGLWQAVGPERAMARNLELDQLQDYYRQRSLLKLPVTAEHVGQAVLFFVTEQTPTTGATLPVDAGVAGAFPR